MRAIATVTVKIMSGQDTHLEGTLKGRITPEQLFDLERIINKTKFRAHLFLVPEKPQPLTPKGD